MSFRVVVLSLALSAVAADEASVPARVANQNALQPLQWVVGQWRGVGQPRRGSNRGAWVERTDWAWKFGEDRATFAFQTENGKYFRSGELRPLESPGEFELLATVPDRDSPLRFIGKYTAPSSDQRERLVLSRPAAIEGEPARISMRQVAGGDRLIVLYERKTGGNRFTRLAEVSSTRQGSKFGRGTSFVECVVTGGLGTIPVTHAGMTYYVCCSGCRDYFNDDPAGVLEEYRQRKATENE